MPQAAHAVILSIAISLLGLLCFEYPSLLNDNNKFLSSFVNHEFLAVPGIVVTISLASAANIHIELNRIEEKISKIIFQRVRYRLKLSAYSLLFILFSAMTLVCTKGAVQEESSWIPFLNSIAIILFIFCMLVLIDLTQAAFSLPSILSKGQKSGDD
jgi:hypothetical protein